MSSSRTETSGDRARALVVLSSVAVLASLAGCASKPKKEFVYLEKTPVIITEVHYNPSKAQGDAEFIEIANVRKSTVDLSGWQVTGAGRLTLPEGTTLRAGEALVVCKSAADLRATFGAEAVAEFKGKLAGKKDTVRVEDPNGNVADEAKYNSKNGQVKRASNTGLSIHRSKVASDDGAIWTARSPSPGRVRVRRS